MEMVERYVSERENLSCYTTRTLACGQMEKVAKLQMELKKFNTKITGKVWKTKHIFCYSDCNLAALFNRGKYCMIQHKNLQST